MLIVFDLDDTLLDTSGSIFPGILKNALIAMQSAGLFVHTFKKSHEELLRLNTFHMNCKDALKEFLNINQAPSNCFEVGMYEIYDNPRFEDPIYPLEDCLEVLQELARRHTLALVTKGKERVQREKMGRAGISTQTFSRLYFCENENKEKAYHKLREESGISPLKALVCGDRISLDLAPAKALGYNTVQMRWGRGLGNTGLKQHVDYTILYLRELKMVLEKIKKLDT